MRLRDSVNGKFSVGKVVCLSMDGMIPVMLAAGRNGEEVLQRSKENVQEIK